MREEVAVGEEGASVKWQWRTTSTIMEAPHGMDAEESEGMAGRAGSELVNDELEKYDE